MEKIGLIAAMPQESEALLHRINKWTSIDIGRYRGYQFQLSGRDCHLITSGIGLVRAAEAARTLVRELSPQILIYFGIGGAVEADLKIGDVVVGETVCLLDQQQLTLSGFRPLASFSTEAWLATAETLGKYSAQLYRGTIITTRGTQILHTGLEKPVHPVLEMETYGVAQTAAEQNIKLIALRSISDGPQAPIPFDLEAMTDENYHLRMGKLLIEVLRKPGMLFQFPRLIRNSGTAADHAAIATIAALEHASLLPYP